MNLSDLTPQQRAWYDEKVELFKSMGVAIPAKMIYDKAKVLTDTDMVKILFVTPKDDQHNLMGVKLFSKDKTYKIEKTDKFNYAIEPDVNPFDEPIFYDLDYIKEHFNIIPLNESLQKQLDDAIAEEDYELAATLRDKINEE